MESPVIYIIVLSTLAIVGVVYISIKLSRRHKADFDLRDRMFCALLENHSEMVAITDRDGSITFCSDRFRDLFCQTETASKIVFFGDLFDTRNRHEYESILQYVYREVKSLVDHQVLINSEDTERELALTVIPILASSGEIVNLIHVLRPVGNKTELASDLGHIEKLTNIGQIAAGMAHELNTPLGSIILSTDIIAEELGSSHSASDEIRKIRAQADHCSKVVKQLLGYVRKDEHLRTEQEIRTVIEKVEELVATEARKRNIAIEIISTSGKSVIMCNENQIEQLFFNLMSNAFHAVKEDSTIVIQISHDDLLDQVTVSFVDQGCGIPHDQIDKIFDPFFTTKSGKEGTGLGLALCKKIMLEHGGRITVESIVDQGTTFMLYFPVSG